MRKYETIISDYEDKYTFVDTCSPDIFKAAIHYGVIFVPLSCDIWRRSSFLFSLLHEIGHCETYRKRQKDITMEFKATQWAIWKSKEYGIKISKEEKNEWQDYIYSFRKNENKSKYLLDWSAM